MAETKLISKPGVYDISAEAYHADPCKVPSFSRSIGHLLLTKTARQAQKAHPRLNPNYRPQHAKQFDIGSAAHALILNDSATIRVVRSKDFRGFAAQKARDVAYASGQIPLLEHDYENAKRMVAAARAQLAMHDDASNAFLEGTPERTLIWKEKVDGVVIWCRIRLDWDPPRGGWLNDFKSTKVTSEPEAFANRVLYPEGLDLQAALYSRGYKAVYGVRPAGFRFIVVEVEDPHPLSTVVLEPGDLDMAMRRVENAMSLWAWSMKTKKWPGHPARDVYVMRSAWREKAWIEREDRETAARDDGADLRARMLEWQAPFDRPKRSAA